MSRSNSTPALLTPQDFFEYIYFIFLKVVVGAILME